MNETMHSTNPSSSASLPAALACAAQHGVRQQLSQHAVRPHPHGMDRARYKDKVMEKIFHRNAERILGL